MNVPRFCNKSAFYFTNITCSCSNIWEVEKSLESQIKLLSSSAPSIVDVLVCDLLVFSVQTHSSSGCVRSGRLTHLALPFWRPGEGQILAVSHELP